MRVHHIATVSEHSSVVRRMAQPYDRETVLSLSGVIMDPSMTSTNSLHDLRDVLNRDQRTVLTSTKRQQCRTSSSSSPSSSSTSYRIYYFSVPATTSKRILRFGEVLTLCACILGVVSLPTTMSAPVSPHSVDFSKPPEWINSCHTDHDSSRQMAEEELESEHDIGRATNKETLNKIVIVAKNALTEVDDKNPNGGDENWTHKFARHYFGTDLKSYYNTWKDTFASDYQKWVPSSRNTHKELGKPIREEGYRELDRSVALRDTFVWLQTIAVGLEQVIIDQKQKHEPFEDQFADAFWLIRAVLCEIESAMLHFQVEKPKDVTREAMPLEVRKYSSEMERNMRDIYILINYINLMEYVRDVFDYLQMQEI